MNDKPYISVGIPFFNSEKYLELAIKSVINQSYPYWELILIDDGSSDRSLVIAEKYAQLDKRIRLISDGKNKKLPTRLNQLVNESKYDYIARMDADDLMHPDRLKKQINFLLENPKYDLVSSGLISIDNENSIRGKRYMDNIFYSFSSISSNYPILHPSILGRKSWFIRNPYSDKYPRAEDFELWTRAIVNKDLNLFVLTEGLMYYREDGDLSYKKIKNTYDDVYKIMKHNNASLLTLFKLKIKSIILFFINKFGKLDLLIQRRNNEFDSVTEKETYQKILMSIIDRES